MAWDAERAEVAEKAAIKEFGTMFSAMSEEERNGVRKLAKWWRLWFNGHADFHATGHKALARHLIGAVNNNVK